MTCSKLQMRAGFMFWRVVFVHIWTCFHLWPGPPFLNNPLEWLWPQSCNILHPDQLIDIAMVVLDVKPLKEPFTVLRPEEFLENNRQFSLFLRITDSFTFFLPFLLARQLPWSRTVPEYIDRSDDVAWMLGCSLILLTIQVSIFININFITDVAWMQPQKCCSFVFCASVTSPLNFHYCMVFQTIQTSGPQD